MDWIKGGETYQLFSRATLDRIGLPLAYHVNTGKLKDRISNSMNVLRWNEGEKQPAWFPNFPENLLKNMQMTTIAENIRRYSAINS